MSRHRSPAGRHPHPRPAPHEAATPGAWPRRTADAPHPGAGVALLERPLTADEWDARRGPVPPPPAIPSRRSAAPVLPLPAPVSPLPSAARSRPAAPAVRNGLVAAAATAGLLSTIAPLASLLPAAEVEPPASGATATLALAADAAAAETAAEAVPVDARLRTVGIEPVRTVVDDLPPEVDAAGLLKAVGLADVARQAEEARAAREAAARCDADLDGLGRVKPFVRDAAQFLACLYDEPDVLGIGQRARASDHPRGLALDLMVRGERGDRIAACALANQDALGVSYVIYEQRVNYGDGWERMSDRGGDTANHYDHVHVSFERGGGSGAALAALCE